MEINITLDVKGATVEEVQWLAGLLAAQRTTPAPIVVEAEKAAPAATADEEKPEPKKTAKKAAKKTAKKSDPEPEPTPEPAPAEDETGGATVEDETVTPEADLLAVAVARATELIGAGEQDAIKTALEVAFSPPARG